jgi:hypothetical protein
MLTGLVVLLHGRGGRFVFWKGESEIYGCRVAELCKTLPVLVCRLWTGLGDAELRGLLINSV